MKDVSEVVACVCDYGTFVSIAQRLAKDFKKVFYHSPVAEEFLTVHKSILGDGVPEIERIDDVDDPDFSKQIDAWIFPDIRFVGLQKRLRAEGKAVWGAFGVDELELMRTKFIDTIEELGLPVVKSVTLHGLTALSEHLKKVNKKYVKLNKFRGDFESFEHIDFAHSEREIERLAKLWGGVKEFPAFVVQDKIDTDIEVGYDGFSIDGRFPQKSFYGYEDKNSLYLGSVRNYEDLPKSVRQVNEAMAPILEQAGYRNFIATEIRYVSPTEFYFIDPTMRMPGQTGEQLLNTCKNLGECIYKGALGEMIVPEFLGNFAAAATITNTAGSAEDWKVLRVPEEAREWTHLTHFCQVDDICHFPPGRLNELGVVVGYGDSIDKAIESLKEHLDLFKDEPVSYETDGFYDLIKSIKSAEDEGLIFSDEEIPDEHEVTATVLD